MITVRGKANVLFQDGKVGEIQSLVACSKCLKAAFVAGRCTIWKIAVMGRKRKPGLTPECLGQEGWTLGKEGTDISSLRPGDSTKFYSNNIQLASLSVRSTSRDSSTMNEKYLKKIQKAQQKQKLNFYIGFTTTCMAFALFQVL